MLKGLYKSSRRLLLMATSWHKTEEHYYTRALLCFQNQ